MIETTVENKQEISQTTPSQEGVVLTETDFNRLKQMLLSKDYENHVVAQNILTKCNVEKSIYWIYKLAGETGTYNMVYLRTKAGRKFRDESSLFSIASDSAESFAKHLLHKQWLTREIFQRLKPKILDDLKEQCSNKFFDLKYRIKDCYTKFDSDPDFNHLNNTQHER